MSRISSTLFLCFDLVRGEGRDAVTSGDVTGDHELDVARRQSGGTRSVTFRWRTGRQDGDSLADLSPREQP